MSTCSWSRGYDGGGQAFGERWRGFGWRPWELVAMIAGFIVFWPIGLAFLLWKVVPRDRWPRWAHRAEEGFRRDSFAYGLHRHSGNTAFEDYKAETLRRLEEERRRLAEEQKAFHAFMEELKRAKDREEFDRFMAGRRNGTSGNGPQGGSPFEPQGGAA